MLCGGIRLVAEESATCATMKFFSRSVGLLLFLAASAFGDDGSNEDDGDYYENQFTVCDESTVLIQDISIMCDSPGTYYYGSNKYRNSATCQAGDKAKLQVDFLILQDLEADAYLTLDIKGYGSVESVSLHGAESFCGAVQATNGAECPEAGYYSISEQFYWGSQSDSYEYSFTPKVIVGVASVQNKNQYDLGGANTNQCGSGNTFTAWTNGVRKTAADTFVSFMLTFGTLLAVILVICGVGWLIMRHAKAREPRKEIIVDEVLDEASYEAIRDHKSLVQPW